MTTETNDKYQVLSHDYENTGGNCMVSIFAVYDKQQNRTLYAAVNDEGFSMNTVDYITQEVDYDDGMQLFYLDFTEPVSSTEWLDYRELMLYCRFEFIKKDCKRWRQHAFISPDDLPQYLKDKMPAGYRDWLVGGDQLVETDGFDIFVDSRYDLTPAVDAHLIACEKLHLMGQLLEEDGIGTLTLTIGDKTETVDLFFADSLGTLDEALKEMFEQHKSEIFSDDDKILAGNYKN